MGHMTITPFKCQPNIRRREHQILLQPEPGLEEVTAARMSRRGRERATGCSLIIRNLSRTTRMDELRHMAEKYGRVRDVYIPVDYMTRLPRGIAFIEYTDPEDAEDAIYGLDRKVYDGREISVQLAMEGRKRPEDAARARFDYAGSPRRRRHRSRSRSRGRSRRARSPTTSRSRSRARTYTPSRSPSDRRSRSPAPSSRSKGRSKSPSRKSP
ncbi:hypothetical protein CVIRNUC_007428 [Coccomyxa viridis]|uniref:RRM domain-containing protein n=1 Tax=Coccomyxa viridis TaxID=1274662 RepID=A0AAV1IAW8_9CHLO|nr:hypothetical protein CVIRNUC_007428 [Coccomyxa viridis]